MIIVLRPDATAEQLQHLVEVIQDAGLKAHISAGTERTIVGAIGDESKISAIPFTAIPGVESAMPIVKPYKLAAKSYHKDKARFKVGNAEIGPDRMTVAGGPCSVEPNDSLIQTARSIKESGATILRGGAFKPRTSPYDFPGLGEEGPYHARRGAAGNGAGGSH